MIRPRGFTYLGLLFFVAITAAALAALGTSWSTAAQRERERELEFRGDEIARAIASYMRASTSAAQQFPTTLDDLLIDARGVKARHHLRRAYADPFTGKPDWVLVPSPGQVRGFNAVHSRSDRVLLREQLADGTPVTKARDWVFSADTAELPGVTKPDPGSGGAAAASAPQP